MRGRSFVASLLMIAGVSLAGRCAYILTVTRHQPNPSMQVRPAKTVRSFDELYYQYGAVRLAAGDGFKNPLFEHLDRQAAYHPPMPILVLTPAAWASDGNVLAMRLTMAIAGAGVVGLTGLIGRELAGPRAGLIAASIAAVYPGMWMNDGILMGETLSTLGVALTVYFTYRLLRRPKWTTAAAAGASAAFAMLSRAELALLLPLLILPVIALSRQIQIRRRMMLGLIVITSALIGVGPWVAYNLSRFEKPVLISYADGDSLIGANCKKSYSGPLIGFHDGTCGLRPGTVDPSIDAAQKRSDAFRYMRSHAKRLPIVMTARVGRVWSLYRPFQMIDLLQTEGRPKWASDLGFAMFLLLACLAVGGAVTLRRQRTPILPVVAPIVIVTVTAALTLGSPRYRAPAEASIVVLAAVALDALLVASRRTSDGAEAIDTEETTARSAPGEHDPSSPERLPVASQR